MHVKDRVRGGKFEIIPAPVSTPAEQDITVVSHMQAKQNLTWWFHSLSPLKNWVTTGNRGTPSGVSAKNRTVA